MMSTVTSQIYKDNGVQDMSYGFSDKGTFYDEMMLPFNDIRDEIEKYRDNEYLYTQLMNSYNKYITQSFQPNMLQKLGEAFGDTSSRQNFINSQITGLRTEIGELLNAQHKEDYTDPSAEIARRKQAGINDDLSGGSAVGTGEPGDLSLPENPQALQNDGSSVVQQVAQIGTSIVSFAMQMYTGFQNVKSLHLENAMKELSLSDNMRSLAWSVIGEGVSEFLGSNKGKYTKEELLDPSFVSLAPSLIQSFGSRINSLPLNRRQRKSMHNIIDDLIYTYYGDVKVPTSKYEALINNMNSDLFKSRNNLAQSSGLIGADSDNIDVIRAIGEDIYKPLNDMQVTLAKSLNRVSQLQAKFDASYYSKANELGLGSTTAESEYASRKLVLELNQAKNEVTKAFKSIRDKILSDKKLKDGWKTALLTGTSISEVFTMNTLLSSTAHLNFGAQFRNNVNDTRDVFLH